MSHQTKKKCLAMTTPRVLSASTLLKRGSIMDAINTSHAREEGRATVNGLSMYYEFAGSGRPAVYVHPFISFGGVHGDALPAHIPTHRWLSMDLQGHGRTADIDRPLSFEQEADDVAALMRHVDIRGADIFGESFGGITAMLLAVRYPELVRRVAIWASSLRPFEETTAPESMAQLYQLTPEHRSVQYQRENYQRVAPDPTDWPNLFTKASRVDWRGLTPEQLKGVEVPVLVCGGDHDVLGPRLEHQLEVARTLPKGEFAVIPDAGHFVVYDAPESILPIIGRFFNASELGVPFATTLSGYHPGETR
jgi:pimeloyl-ACP methyl ester carboxylesterase